MTYELWTSPKTTQTTKRHTITKQGQACCKRAICILLLLFLEF